MGKTTSSTPLTAPRPPGETVPLARISIQFTRPAVYYGETDEQPLTITGTQLAVILRWLALAHHGRIEAFVNPEAFALTAAGVGEACQGLAQVNFADGIDQNAIFATLGDILTDLSHRITAKDEFAKTAQHALVTIHPATAPAAAA